MIGQGETSNMPLPCCNIPLALDEHDPQSRLDSLYDLIDCLTGRVPQDFLVDRRRRLLHLAEDFSIFPSRIKKNHILLEHEAPYIGEGATSIVVCRYDDADVVAVKEFKITLATKERARRSFIKEAIIMASLRHKNIIPFRGVIYSASKFAITTPFMRNGDLPLYLKRNPYVNRIDLVIQIAHGLQYLKTCGVIHGDLKGANILVDDHGTPYIADFGLAIYYGDTATPEGTPGMGSSAGTRRYMSPERLLPASTKSARPTFASDIFSFGMVIYEVYTGQVPYYSSKHDYQIILKIIGGIRPERDAHIPNDIWSLAEMCWSTRVSRRPHINEVVDRLSTLNQDST